MALRVDLEPSQTSVKVRRPDESEISINWQKNGEVQTITEDLIDAGWVVFKGQALRWEQGAMIDQKQVTQFEVLRASEKLRNALIKIPPDRKRHPPSGQPLRQLGCV